MDVSQSMSAALSHHQAGRQNEAERICRQVVAACPDIAEAWELLGVIALHRGNCEAAVDCSERAVGLAPNSAQAYGNRGLALKYQGRLEEAIQSSRRALALDSTLADVHSNLGNMLLEQGQVEDAIECFRRAIQLNPERPDFQFNLGGAYHDQMALDQAIDCYRRALALKPDFADACYNLGVALKDQRQLDEAAAWFRRTLELDPQHAQAHCFLSLVMLLQGDLERGLPEYEWRWEVGLLRARHFEQPQWNGQALAGKTILICAEQGLGDTIQFVRYAPLVKNLGATVLFECQRPLAKLLAPCAGIDRLVEKGAQLPEFDFYLPLLSLPRLLKTSLATIPANVPYLFPDPGLIALWRQKLQKLGPFRIGINWQGRPGKGDFRCRNIPLDCFAPLTSLPGVQLISLQRGKARCELAERGGRFNVIDPGDFVDQVHGAFMDTAAIMKNLDLVITSDTSVAHLAGALAVPVWVALPFVPDWRWLLDRSDSPWYPTMRLFRQPQAGDWASVFAEIQSALHSASVGAE